MTVYVVYNTTLLMNICWGFVRNFDEDYLVDEGCFFFLFLSDTEYA